MIYKHRMLLAAAILATFTTTSADSFDRELRRTQQQQQQQNQQTENQEAPEEEEEEDNPLQVWRAEHDPDEEEGFPEGIIGGIKATADDGYVWFGRALRGTSWWGCGGSFISPEYILSAGHCSWNTGASWQVGALCTPYRKGNNCDQDVEVRGTRKVWRHEDYGSGSSGIGHDFALLRLDSPITNIEPVPIDSEGLSNSYTGGEKTWAIGFGNTNTASSSYPNHLRHVEVGYVTNEACNGETGDFTGYPGSIDANMMCAADPGEDACQGDSGGPLYDKNNNVLVGITSWGRGCAMAQYPGVYSRIADQFDWIKNIVCENHNEPLPDFCIDGTKKPTKSPAPSPTPKTKSPTKSPAPTSDLSDAGDSIVINNGKVMIGMHKQGHLNVPGDPDAHNGVESVGVRYNRGGKWYDSTAFGCTCEGFGVSAKKIGGGGGTVWGGANDAQSIENMSDETLVGNGVKAIATATADNALKIVHAFAPSTKTARMYIGKVTITNILSVPVKEVRYRRVMDWDIPPTIFNECVSVFWPGDTPDFLESVSDNGFANVDPSSANTGTTGAGGITCPNGTGCPKLDQGPKDHGGTFQFMFKNNDGSPKVLAPGESLSFELMYGAAYNKVGAQKALDLVKAEAATFGYPPKDGSCGASVDGTPNVFIMAFKGVGGKSFGPDEPTTKPTAAPTKTPTKTPNADPTATPTPAPTGTPTEPPTKNPTVSPAPTNDCFENPMKTYVRKLIVRDGEVVDIKYGKCRGIRNNPNHREICKNSLELGSILSAKKTCPISCRICRPEASE